MEGKLSDPLSSQCLTSIIPYVACCYYLSHCALARFASHRCGPSSIPGLGRGRMCENVSSVTCRRSVVSSGCSGFLHQKTDFIIISPPWYDPGCCWGVKPLNQTKTCYYLSLSFYNLIPTLCPWQSIITCSSQNVPIILTEGPAPVETNRDWTWKDDTLSERTNLRYSWEGAGGGGCLPSKRWNDGKENAKRWKRTGG